MNWRNIRVYNNSQNNAFEELVCQLARQAKYAFDIDSVIVQADKSYNTALKSHSDMCTFVVAIPFDLPDLQYEKDGKAVKSALEKWNAKVSFWEEKAKKIEMLR